MNMNLIQHPVLVGHYQMVTQRIEEGYQLDHVEVYNSNMIKIDNEQVCEAFAVMLNYMAIAKMNIETVWSRGIN